MIEKYIYSVRRLFEPANANLKGSFKGTVFFWEHITGQDTSEVIDCRSSWHDLSNTCIVIGLENVPLCENRNSWAALARLHVISAFQNYRSKYIGSFFVALFLIAYQVSVTLSLHLDFKSSSGHLRVMNRYIEATLSQFGDDCYCRSAPCIRCILLIAESKNCDLDSFLFTGTLDLLLVWND